MNIYLYLREDKIYNLKEGKEELISFDNLENFVKENQKNFFVIVISKLNIYFRKIEFGFRDKKKINLILNQELEGKLPKPSDKFYFYLDFHSEKDKTIVNLFAIEKEKIDIIKKIFKENKVKFYFTIDAIFLHQFLKEKIHDKNFIEIFVEDDYFILNLIENSKISNIYSYFSKNIKNTVIELFDLLISAKKIPVFFIGKRDIYEEIKFDEMKFLTEKKLLNILKEIKKIPIVDFHPLHIPKKFFKLEYVIYFLFLLIISGLFITPYFERKKSEKKLEEINKKMENIYKNFFPETTKIVNPLIQIKEKIAQSSLKIPVSEISIIKILEEITILFPEDIKVEIEELILAGNKVNLSGKIDNLKNLDRIKENVRKSKIFTNFEITSISFTKEGNVRFNLLLKM